MANAIKKYDNGLSIRYIKKSKAYFITFGVTHIKVNGEYLKGFVDFQEAEDFLKALKSIPYILGNTPTTADRIDACVVSTPDAADYFRKSVKSGVLLGIKIIKLNY